MSAVGHFAVAAAAYLAAAFAVSLLLTLGIPLIENARGETYTLFTSPSLVLALTAAFAGWLAALGLLPALFFIAWSEWRSQKRPSFFAVSGAAAALLALAALDGGQTLAGTSADPAATGWLAVAGAVGGLVYWAIAGRRAGAWRALRRLS